MKYKVSSKPWPRPLSPPPSQVHRRTSVVVPGRGIEVPTRCLRFGWSLHPAYKKKKHDLSLFYQRAEVKRSRSYLRTYVQHEAPTNQNCSQTEQSLNHEDGEENSQDTPNQNLEAFKQLDQ